MKTMTCNQLGGACDKEFQANTFEEISEMSKNHGMEMFQNTRTWETNTGAKKNLQCRSLNLQLY